MKKLLLLLAALIWGVAFVAQSVGMDYMGPFTFNGARFLMGSAVLVPVILFRRKKADPAGGRQVRTDRSGAKENAGKAALMGGVCCGLALCPAALFQQFGILYTTVGKAGFITTLYIILVPLAGILQYVG